MLMSPSVALFVWNNTLAVWLALRLGRRLLPGAAAADRALAATVLFVSITLACLQFLGFTGLLTGTNVALLLGLLALGEWLEAARRPTDATADAPPASSSTPPSLAARTLIGAVCLWCAWTVLTAGVHYGWDTQTYHAVAPAWWIQRGAIEIPPFNYQGYYPFNVELHALWFMLPFRADAHVTLAMFSWVAILVAAVAVHGRILGQSSLLTAIALSAFLLAPPVRHRLMFFTSNDLSVAAMLMALLALAWIPKGDEGVTRRALLCGLAGGAALGMKPTTAPFVFFVGLWWLWRLGWGRAAVRTALVYSAAVLALGSAWYVRNLALTGNPLFPAAVGPFEGPLDAEAQRATSLLPVLIERGGELAFWTDLLRSYLDWPLGLGVAAVLGYVVGAWTWIRGKDRLRRAHLFMLLLSGIVYLALFPLQPFSATANRPAGPFVVYLRYITFSVLVGLVLLPSLRRPARRTLESSALEPSARRRAPVWLVPGLVALASLGLGLATPAREAAAAEQLGRFGMGNFGGLWAAIDALPDGARIAVLSRDPPSHTLVYPLFGRRLQHEPVALYADGRMREPLHEVWRKHRGGWWWEFQKGDPKRRARVLARNLRAAKVDFLVLNRWPPPPNRAAALAFLPRWAQLGRLSSERRVYQDKDSEIWDLRPTSAEIERPDSLTGRKSEKPAVPAMENGNR